MSDDPLTPEVSLEPQHLVGTNPRGKFGGNKLTEDYGAYQTTFNQENYKRSPQSQFKEDQKSLQTSRPGDGSNERESFYYNEDITRQDPGSRPQRRRKRKNKYFQDRRLLTEKYFPKEKYFKPRENYYEDSLYDDLELAYNEPLITVEPVVENRQFTTVG